VWLKDPWSSSASPGGQAVIGVQHLYRFTGSHVQEIVSVKTFSVSAAGPGVPLVKEPKIGVTLRGNGDYNQIRYYVQADGAERLVGAVKRGQPEYAPYLDANNVGHSDSLNTVQDAPANRFKVEWGDGSACNGTCFDVVARAMKPLWIQTGSTLDPFNRDRILWAQQSIGLNGWALSSAARDNAYVRDTNGAGQITNCSADPAIRGHRTDYPPGDAGLHGWWAHLEALSEDSNPGIPEVRRWEIGGWKNGLTSGQRDSNLPYTGSFVLLHGWEGAEGPSDCEPLMVTVGSGVYTNYLDFSFR
jgi:hypothetical protein